VLLNAFFSGSEYLKNDTSYKALPQAPNLGFRGKPWKKTKKGEKKAK